MGLLKWRAIPKPIHPTWARAHSLNVKTEDHFLGICSIKGKLNQLETNRPAASIDHQIWYYIFAV